MLCRQKFYKHWFIKLKSQEQSSSKIVIISSSDKLSTNTNTFFINDMVFHATLMMWINPWPSYLWKKTMDEERDSISLLNMD